MINATLYEKLGYNFIRDMTPVASIGRGTSPRRSPSPWWSTFNCGSAGELPRRAIQANAPEVTITLWFVGTVGKPPFELSQCAFC
jgi:hypothetical protein